MVRSSGRGGKSASAVQECGGATPRARAPAPAAPPVTLLQYYKAQQAQQALQQQVQQAEQAAKAQVSTEVAGRVSASCLLYAVVVGWYRLRVSLRMGKPALPVGGGHSPPILGNQCAPVRCKWHI